MNGRQTIKQSLGMFAHSAEQYQSADDLASFLQVHPKTILRLAREGKIPAHPFGDGQRKRWRFLISEVDTWLRARVPSSNHPCREKETIL